MKITTSNKISKISKNMNQNGGDPLGVPQWEEGRKAANRASFSLQAAALATPRACRAVASARDSGS